MNNILNQLIQLQELNFAREEQKASNPRMPLAQLEKSIAEIHAQLPPDIAERYDRLQQRYPLAVIDRPVETGIARFSAANLMVPKLEASTREGVIRELAKTLGEGGFVEDTATLTELALRREAIVSTAVEHGLAFPHVRDVEGGGLTFAVGMKEKGIKFGAPDDHLSKIFFFIVIPTPATAFYLRLLAGLVRTFESTEARKELLDCDAPEKMWKTLVKLTKTTVP
ncbi:MAG: PTS sugar transporter subunit IIA [Verrucomicrobiia bacterium]